MKIILPKSETAKLRREVSFIALIAVMVGLNIGGSLFLLTGIAAGMTGPSLFIAQLLSALPILLALIPYMVLTSAMPVTCANYQYAKLLSTPLASAAWMVMFIAIPVGAFPLFAIATAKLIAVLVPGIPIAITAIGVMTLFYVINLVGIRATAQVQLATVFILMLALLTFIIPGLQAIDVRNMTPLFTGGMLGFIGASALIFTLLAGGLFGIEIGGEVKNARSTIPKALIISIGIVLLIYLLVEIVATGVIGWNVFKNETLGIPAQVFLSQPWLGFFVIGGGILASITTINLTLTVAGRYALVYARDGFFPRFFGHINSKFSTPHWGLTLPFVITIITILFDPPLQTLGAMLNFGLLFMITLVLLAAARLPKTYPDIYAKSNFKFKPRTIAVVSYIAAAINIIFMILLAWGLKVTFLLFVIAAIAGIGLYFARRTQVRRATAGYAIEQAE